MWLPQKRRSRNFRKLHSRRIELLAPARDLATGRVAVDAGADAVYIGGPGFGARRAAGNPVEDVEALVRYARPFGVRVYATLNTLLFDDELDEARRVGRELIDAGVDALIVQDMAWLRMDLSGVGTPTADLAARNGVVGTPVAGLAARNGVEFHASTQTSNMRPEEVAFLGRAGFRRVILERALTMEEIRAIREVCPAEVELEVFVHGAICVGYSGRCFMSRAADSGRSGNRGDCSQPCRLAYDLVERGDDAGGGDGGGGDGGGGDGGGGACGGAREGAREGARGGEGRIVMKGKHLLSLCDLDLSARVGELLDAGVSSLKIEGRLKDAAYVRNVVSHYRRVVDEALAVRPELRRASVGRAEPDFVPDPAKSFARGRTEYFLDGAVRGVASVDTPKAMGEMVGTVGRVACERMGNRYFTLENQVVPLAAGDGICFFAGGELRGTNVNRIEAGRVYPNMCEGIEAGMEIFRNHDHAFVRALERSRMRRRIGVEASVVAGMSRIEVTFVDETGVTVGVVQDGAFEPARDPLKMGAVIRGELARSGDTIFEVRGVEICGGVDGGDGGDGGDGPDGGDGVVVPFIPVSTLARMRREGLERLLEARAGLAVERHTAEEDPAAVFPRTRLEAEENVTNRLAENFWRDHGVTEIAPALELKGVRCGEVVMRTRYCIRRETGECLRAAGAAGAAAGRVRGETEGPEGTGQGDLWLERGRERWRLGFDCAKCEMVVMTTADSDAAGAELLKRT